MKPRAIIWRMVVEVFILLATFSAVGALTSPSESTAAAVTAAVSKNQLEPVCMVEMQSAIHSAGFLKVALFVITIAAVILFCSDVLALWQSRRKI